MSVWQASRSARSLQRRGGRVPPECRRTGHSVAQQRPESFALQTEQPLARPPIVLEQLTSVAAESASDLMASMLGRRSWRPLSRGTANAPVQTAATISSNSPDGRRHLDRIQSSIQAAQHRRPFRGRTPVRSTGMRRHALADHLDQLGHPARGTLAGPTAARAAVVPGCVRGEVGSSAHLRGSRAVRGVDHPRDRAAACSPGSPSRAVQEPPVRGTLLVVLL